MILAVHYRGQKIGLLSDDVTEGIVFEFEKDWLENGLELSPLCLPKRAGLQQHNNAAFQGLHGLFFDSLPDAWGTKLMEEKFVERGIPRDRITPLAELSFVGARAMGAMSYHPDSEGKTEPRVMETVELARYDREARKVIEGKTHAILPDLIRLGSSAGGARPKVLVAIQDDNGDHIVHGVSEIPKGYSGWLLKLAVQPNAPEDKQYGRVEYAYSLMGRAAGLAVPETRLIVQQGQAGAVGYFATKRFDRGPGRGEKQKIHVHSLCGVNHLDFNLPSSYEELFEVTSRLTHKQAELQEAFRRLAFNVLAVNCDDHPKNFSFIMDDRGEWKLSPAYDLTFSTGMGKKAQHAMSVHGVRENPTRQDCLDAAKDYGVLKAEDIWDQVQSSISGWEGFAQQAGLSEKRKKELAAGMNLPGEDGGEEEKQGRKV